LRCSSEGASAPTLQAVQSILTLNTHLLRTRVEGHANDSDDTAKNLDLSRRRARTTARWLIARGIAATRLELVACGARYPIATERTESARQADRRVEFYVVDPAPKEPLAHPDCEPIELR
jgi:outer membrane protein OmpA-like peptidoglycan-associated protein